MSSGLRIESRTTGIDGRNERQSKVPHKIWMDKRSHESTGSSIYMDACLPAIFLVLSQEQVVDRLDIFVLAVVRRAENRGNTNRILIDQVHGLFRVDNETILGTVDKTRFNFEILDGL